MATKDDLVSAIGTPPTADSIANAILLATTAPAAAEPAPADHGLDPADPAVTQVPRDETGDSVTQDGGLTADAIAKRTADAQAKVDADKAAVAADEDKLAADQATEQTDEATLATEAVDTLA